MRFEQFVKSVVVLPFPFISLEWKYELGFLTNLSHSSSKRIADSCCSNLRVKKAANLLHEVLFCLSWHQEVVSLGIILRIELFQAEDKDMFARFCQFHE